MQSPNQEILLNNSASYKAKGKILVEAFGAYKNELCDVFEIKKNDSAIDKLVEYAAKDKKITMIVLTNFVGKDDFTLAICSENRIFFFDMLGFTKKYPVSLNKIIGGINKKNSALKLRFMRNKLNNKFLDFSSRLTCVIFHWAEHLIKLMNGDEAHVFQLIDEVDKKVEYRRIMFDDDTETKIASFDCGGFMPEDIKKIFHEDTINQELVDLGEILTGIYSNHSVKLSRYIHCTKPSLDYAQTLIDCIPKTALQQQADDSKKDKTIAIISEHNIPDQQLKELSNGKDRIDILLRQGKKQIIFMISLGQYYHKGEYLESQMNILHLVTQAYMKLEHIYPSHNFSKVLSEWEIRIVVGDYLRAYSSLNDKQELKKYKDWTGNDNGAADPRQWEKEVREQLDEIRYNMSMEFFTWKEEAKIQFETIKKQLIEKIIFDYKFLNWNESMKIVVDHINEKLYTQGNVEFEKRVNYLVDKFKEGYSNVCKDPEKVTKYTLRYIVEETVVFYYLFKGICFEKYDPNSQVLYSYPGHIKQILHKGFKIIEEYDERHSPALTVIKKNDYCLVIQHISKDELTKKICVHSYFTGNLKKM